MLHHLFEKGLGVFDCFPGPVEQTTLLARFARDECRGACSDLNRTFADLVWLDSGDIRRRMRTCAECQVGS